MDVVALVCVDPSPAVAWKISSGLSGDATSQRQAFDRTQPLLPRGADTFKRLTATAKRHGTTPWPLWLCAGTVWGPVWTQYDAPGPAVETVFAVQINVTGKR